MSNLDQTQEQPIEQLMDELENVRAGMLGIAGLDAHMQPMSPNVDRDHRKVWFFTNRETDLYKTIGEGKKAHFCVIGDNHDYHACLSGRIKASHDQQKVDRYWSSIVGAWFKGKDDPDLALLEFTPDEAEIWSSTGNPIRFGWEIMRSNVEDRTPDIGVRRTVQLS